MPSVRLEVHCLLLMTMKFMCIVVLHIVCSGLERKAEEDVWT